MADWLRPVFARSKTPLPPATSNTSQDATEPGLPPISRPKASSRVASYINLHNSTPLLPLSDSFLGFRDPRDPETVYHKPSGDQMAEMVKVAMMNQSSVAPIPVQYNSAILHVLEAYHELREELGKKEDVVVEMKQSHEKDIRDFEGLAKQWEEKEKNYKTELKNLEVLLSRTVGGLEKVSLARTKSTIHGSVKASESIRTVITTIKERNSARNTKARGQSGTKTSDLNTCDMHPDDITGKKLLHPQVINRKNRRSRINQTTNADKFDQQHSNDRLLSARSSDDNFPRYSSPPEGNQKRKNLEPGPFRLTKTQLETLERQQAELAIDSSFDSSLSGSSSIIQALQAADHETKPLGMHMKQLPTIPIQRSSTVDRHAMYEGTDFESMGHILTTPSQMGFSFNPGDDADLDTLAGVSEVLYMAPSKAAQPQLAIKEPKSTPKTSVSSLHAYKTTKNNNSLVRYDSTNSVITAVRHNSGKSSTTGSFRDSQSGWPKANKSSGSNEAITAAVRAIAGSSASKIPRRSLSGTGSTNSRGNARRGSSEAVDESKDSNGITRVDSRSGSGEASGSQHKKLEIAGGGGNARSSTVFVVEAPIKSLKSKR